jgi:hypothetical protein
VVASPGQNPNLYYALVREYRILCEATGHTLILMCANFALRRPVQTNYGRSSMIWDPGFERNPFEPFTVTVVLMNF